MKPKLYCCFRNKKQVSPIFWGPNAEAEAQEWRNLRCIQSKVVEVTERNEAKGYIATAYGHEK